MRLQHWWSDADGRTEVHGETPVLMPLVELNLRLYWAEWNPGLRGERLATSRLSHGTRDMLLNIECSEESAMSPVKHVPTFRKNVRKYLPLDAVYHPRKLSLNVSLALKQHYAVDGKWPIRRVQNLRLAVGCLNTLDKNTTKMSTCDFELVWKLVSGTERSECWAEGDEGSSAVQFALPVVLCDNCNWKYCFFVNRKDTRKHFYL
jgi:hypothetical protein